MATTEGSHKRKKNRSTEDDSFQSGKQYSLEFQSSVVEELDPLLLVSFPGGVVQENLELKHESVNGSSWKCQLRGETREMEYSGSNYGRNHHNLDTAQWLVGVADMKTDVISVYPVSHPFPLRSGLKGAQKMNTANESVESSARERRALLFEDFGASKKKRALAASAANLVSSEQAIGADALSSWMDKGPQSGDQPEMDDTDAALVEGRRGLLPNFNLKAESANECFDVRGIVGESERSALARQYDSLKSSSDWLDSEPVSLWTPFVLSRLGQVNKEREDMVDLFLLRHLMAIYVRRSKFFRGPLKDDAKALEMPTEVLKSLLDKFAVSSDPKGDGNLAWRMTKKLQDKLVFHLLTLALKVSSFRLHTSELMGDLKMSSSELANYFRLSGCRVSPDKERGGHTVVLTTPLTFPGRRHKRN